MDAFANVPRAGKIAMRFETDEGDQDPSDRLIGVTLLTEDDDVFLATRNGRAIRFRATDVREVKSRTSTGMRGARLREDDEVISLSILRTTPFDNETREAYLRAAPWKEGDREATLSAEDMAAMQRGEEFILTVCANGYGKRTSAYEYRRIGRGGQGITNIENLDRNGPVVASFPAHNGEQLMLVTDQAKVIRMSVGDTRVIGRNSAGVKLFDVAENEHVVSAARLDEEVEAENDAEALVADDLGAVPAADQITLDDGTGPQTLAERVEEEDPEGDGE